MAAAEDDRLDRPGGAAALPRAFTALVLPRQTQAEQATGGAGTPDTTPSTRLTIWLAGRRPTALRAGGLRARPADLRRGLAAGVHVFGDGAELADAARLRLPDVGVANLVPVAGMLFDFLRMAPPGWSWPAIRRRRLWWMRWRTNVLKWLFVGGSFGLLLFGLAGRAGAGCGGRGSEGCPLQVRLTQPDSPAQRPSYSRSMKNQRWPSRSSAR